MSMYDKNMNKDKRESFEFAEESREEWNLPSFSALLYQGHVRWDLLYPFSAQSPEDKKIGDEYCAKLEKFLKEKLDPDEIDATGEIPKEVFDGLTELKAFAMKIPKEYGGLGFSYTNYSRALHLIGSYCGSTTALLSAHQSIGVPQPLLMFGTEEQKKKYLPRFAEGAVSAFALTEVGAGSDPRSMSTTATLTEDGNHFLLNGEKLWCTNGVIADIIVVMAVTPPKIVNGKERKQITAFIVEMDWPGIEVKHRCRFMGLKALYNAVIEFKDVKVPKENIVLGEGKGLALALQTLNTGRLSIPAAVTGLSKWCMYMTRDWANERVQWGHSIGEHETIAGKIGKMSADTFAQDAVSSVCMAMADNKRFDIRLEAAVDKYFGTETGYHLVNEALQIRSGRGFETGPSLEARGEKNYPVERALRDSRINLIFEGSSEIMNLFIAREALDFHLQKIQPLFSPKTSMGQKIGATLKMMMEYAIWYPGLYIPTHLFASFGLPSPLNKHMKDVKKLSKKMSRVLFHHMMMYQKKMVEKQLVLNRFVAIGNDLFVISACCTFAAHLAKTEGRDNAIELADLACEQAKARIAENFRGLKKNHDKTTLKVAKNMLKSDYKWMEENIMKKYDH